MLFRSELFSAQDRKRSYWTNIKFSDLPTISELMVEDILEIEVDAKYHIEPKRSVLICENEIKKRKIGFIGSDSQANRIYSIHGKSVCLCGEAGGLGAKTGLYQNNQVVKFNYHHKHINLKKNKHYLLMNDYLTLKRMH